MPPSRNLRQRAPVAADPAAAGAGSEPAAEASSSSGPRGPRAPGRQPYLPLSVEGGSSAALDALAPTASSGLQQGLRSLAAAIGIGPSEPAKRDDDLEANGRGRASKVKRSESAELPPSSSAGQASSGGGPRLVPVLVERDPRLDGSSAANGSGPLGPSSGGGGAAGTHPSGTPRRVAFETTVADDDGGSQPLRSESANDRSEFVRGVGRVDRWVLLGGGWVGANQGPALVRVRLPRACPPTRHLCCCTPAGPGWTA